MIRDDHIIGNHTIDHKNLAKLTHEKIRQQFIENQELLNRETGEDAQNQ